VSVQYPHVRVEGGPRERGRQYGEQTRERVRRSIEGYREVFEKYAGWSWDKVTAEARRFEPVIADYGARYIEEIHGVAEGASVPPEDILAVNVRTEVMFAAKARQATAPAVECSAIAALPEATASGHTVVAQNWDWLLHSADTVVVLEAHQDDGPDFVTVVEAGLLAKSGLNSSGLGLVTNALITNEDAGHPGVPYHIVLRAILDAETISDALAAIQRRPRSSSANYLIAHEDRFAVDVEAAPGDFSRLFLLFPQNGILLHTNHYVSQAFDLKDVTLWLLPDSVFRLERLRAVAAAGVGELSIKGLKSALADHSNYPHSLCCHPDLRLEPHERAASVASVLMDLDARRLWVADGNPCTHPYRELDYSDFLGKPASLRSVVTG
jgi:isopenicillin-N N-acyltransferase-like protein